MEQISPHFIENTIVENAIEWHLKLQIPEATSEDYAQFEAWCKLNTVHRVAYQRLERLWGKLDGIDPNLAKLSLEAASVPQKSTYKKSKTKRKISKGISIVLFTTVLCNAGYQTQTAKTWLAQNKTYIGEQRHMNLSDGSELTLNTDTALDIDFNAAQRSIKLFKGEIYIKVAKDQVRPLIITTGQGTVRALGTQFNVRLVDDSSPALTQVTVVESTVEVCNKPSMFNFNPPLCNQIHAGQAIQFSQNKMDTKTHLDAQSQTSWITGMMALDNQPLPNVLHELQRYSPARLIFDAATLADMRVSGVLPLNDMNKCLSLLSDKLPIQTRQPFANTIVIEAR